jgi:hypothetical protein
MRHVTNPPANTINQARAAIAPLVVGSQIEVQLRGGATQEGRYDELRRTEVVISEQVFALSEVTAVFHVTSQAHE